MSVAESWGFGCVIRVFRVTGTVFPDAEGWLG